jgi:hypothetical protein
MIAIMTAATQANKNAFMMSDSLFSAITFVFYSVYIFDRHDGAYSCNRYRGRKRVPQLSLPL